MIQKQKGAIPLIMIAVVLALLALGGGAVYYRGSALTILSKTESFLEKFSHRLSLLIESKSQGVNPPAKSDLAAAKFDLAPAGRPSPRWKSGNSYFSLSWEVLS